MNQPLPSYPDYKPASLPWLEQVPEHWEVKRNKYLFRERDTRSQTGAEELLTVSQYTGITKRADRRKHEEELLTTAASLVGYKTVTKDDLVINIMLAWNGSLGISDFEGIVSPAYCVYRPTSKNDPRYFHYLFRTPLYKAMYKAASTGVVDSRLRLYSDKFFALPALLPPLAEQQQIVAFLDAKEQQIARLLRAKRRLIKLLQEQKQALIHRAVTQGLNPSAPCKDSGVAWLGEVPAHWEVRRLKTLIKNVIQQTTSKDAGDTYVALENIEGWTGKLSFSSEEILFESQVKRFVPGDILFGKLRPYLAKVVQPDFKGVCVGELLVLRALPDSLVTQDFIEHKLRSKTIIDLITSSTFGAKMPRADWDFIGNIPCAFPPNEDEQQDIVSYIRKETHLLDEIISRAQREIELIQEYRTRLIADVVTGRVDVRGLAVASSAAADLGLLDEEEAAEEELLEENAETDG